MKNLNSILFAAGISAALVIAGCSPTSSNPDSGTNTSPDSGTNTTPDSGSMNPDSGSMNMTDAGPSCVGDGGCYACAPTTYAQIINACTNAQYVVKNPTLPLLADGGLPALP